MEQPTEIFWPELEEHESKRVKRRRRRLRELGWLDESAPRHRVGLALSGGGIRSATFSLGILKALSRLKILPKVDYLSTVSGGGYAGSFYCSLFVPSQMRGAFSSKAVDERKAREWTKARAIELKQDVLGEVIGRRSIEQLRESGHFLNPNGTSDALFAAVVAFRNWSAVALLTGTLLLAIFLAVNLPRMIDYPLLRSFNGAIAELAAEPWSGAAGADLGTAMALPPEPAPSAWGASWLWMGVALLIPLWIAPSAWAYWLTRTGTVHKRRRRRLLSIPTSIAMAVGVLASLFGLGHPKPGFYQLVLVAALTLSAFGSIIYYVAAEALCRRDETQVLDAVRDPATLLAEENRVRAKLSRWLFRGLFTAMVLSILALSDDIGRLLYDTFLHGTEGRDKATKAGALLALIVPAARWLMKRADGSDLLSRRGIGQLLRRFGRQLALLVGVILFLALLTFWSSVAYAIAWQGETVVVAGTFRAWEGVLGPPWGPPLAITMFITACALLGGLEYGFLNQSSLASFYGARLRKAYLGASNPLRVEERVPADLELRTDEIDLDAYYHPAVWAPIHLINITINETTSESSRVIQRDRKGKGLTVSPAGYIFGKGAPSEEPVGFDLAKGEQLPLSTWMGISGAAFSTGMGQHTSLGLSLLAGLTNLRLGYWWDSPHHGKWRDDERKRHPLVGTWLAVKDFFGDFVQAYLLREIRDDYEGTHSNRWYLSDGGHFENSGIYELVRRRVKFIIACDNGADPRYEFSDFVNLVRKMRIDLNAETELVSNAELDRLLGADTGLRRAFGALEDLAGGEDKGGKRVAGPYAALARIKMPEQGGKPATVLTLLLIKPRVAGDELPDLIRYKKVNITFPQQPTTDLFFDEAQWESYYRLGQLIAEIVFTAEGRKPARHGRRRRRDAKPPWHPVRLQPLP